MMRFVRCAVVMGVVAVVCVMSAAPPPHKVGPVDKNGFGFLKPVHHKGGFPKLKEPMQKAKSKVGSKVKEAIQKAKSKGGIMKEFLRKFSKNRAMKMLHSTKEKPKILKPEKMKDVKPEKMKDVKKHFLKEKLKDLKTNLKAGFPDPEARKIAMRREATKVPRKSSETTRRAKRNMPRPAVENAPKKHRVTPTKRERAQKRRPHYNREVESLWERAKNAGFGDEEMAKIQRQLEVVEKEMKKLRMEQMKTDVTDEGDARISKDIRLEKQLRKVTDYIRAGPSRVEGEVH